MAHSGVYIVQGEVALVLAAMKKGSRWRQDDDQDPLVDGFSQLKEVLTGVADLTQLDPDVYLTPFLDVIKSEDTTGPITGVALSSVHKFLSYGTIDYGAASSSVAVANLADAVTHARFVGTDPASDEVVLMKILQVLRTLLLTEVGSLMTDECVCEIMQSCFRICFEARLSDLLRRTAEQTLMDMMQLLFLRLPQFTETSQQLAAGSEIQMLHRSTSTGQPSSPTHTSTVDLSEKDRQPVAGAGDAGSSGGSSVAADATASSSSSPPQLQDRDAAEVSNALVTAGSDVGTATTVVAGGDSSAAPQPAPAGLSQILAGSARIDSGADTEADSSAEGGGSRNFMDSDTETFANSHGVRFSQQPTKDKLQPYGLGCVCELFRFLISLCNPADKHNSENMIHTALSLLTVALECGAATMMHFPQLVGHIQDDLCRNLFSLLKSPLLGLYAAGLRVFFLCFASMRQILKFQLEMFLTNLQELIASDAQQATIERKEIALDFLVQLCRIPGFAAELYINFDCQPYTTDILEDLTKLLSKHAYPVSGLYSTHRLCVDALLAIVQAIDSSRSGAGSVAASSFSARSRFEKGPLQAPLKIGFGLRRWNSDPRMHSSDPLASSAHDPAQGGVPHFPPGSAQQVVTWALDAPETPDATPAPAPGAGESDGAAVADGDSSSPDAPDPAGPTSSDSSSSSKANLFGVDFCQAMPTAGQLIEVKQKKKLLLAGTDLFNTKPKKGLAFLQEHAIFSETLSAEECADFLKNNCRLDKKMIGEFIGDRKNEEIMTEFVRKFDFTNQSMDVGLRQFLESFRLPGEAPIILRLLEAFSAHWMESNPSASEQVAEAESASVLAYAIIMLNTDQHNPKSVQPMTFHDFKRNQRGTNGGKDYPEDMLMVIYKNIKENEIVMPAERAGEVLENYLWKMLLARGSSSEGRFRHVSSGQLDQDVFHLVWGPVVAALSYIFDNSQRQAVVVKSMLGFKKCASVAAHFNLSDVFDNLIITLCKFTVLLSPPESTSGESFASIFGSNPKAQLTTRTLFSLSRRYGDIIREGWKNILDCVLQLYRARLLPESLIKVDDFADPSGFVYLLREEQTTQKSESWFSWLSDSGAGRKASAEEIEAQKRASQCIKDCKVELLVTESKFLRLESLLELIKTVTFGSHGPVTHQSLGTQFDEDSAIFHLELLIGISIKNRDRLSDLWPGIKEHLEQLISTATRPTRLVERAVVGLLRVIIRMLRREKMVNEVLPSLQILLRIQPDIWTALRRQISSGLYELLRHCSATITQTKDWATILLLLEYTGSQVPMQIPPSHFERVPEETDSSGGASDRSSSGGVTGAGGGGAGSASIPDAVEMQFINKWMQAAVPETARCAVEDFDSLARSCESLACLVRDRRMLNKRNIALCVHAVRTLGQATSSGVVTAPASPGGVRGDSAARTQTPPAVHGGGGAGGGTGGGGQASRPGSRAQSVPPARHRSVETNHTNLSNQVLDLMHTLHDHAAVLFVSSGDASPAARYSEQRWVWQHCWCPLQRGIAQFCCDRRSQVRQMAFTYLEKTTHRCFLYAEEWHSCFLEVLFPLMSALLRDIDPGHMEEMRKRATHLAIKVFLQHLGPLSQLDKFLLLWLNLLEFFHRFVMIGGTDLEEHITESLKNALLVMATADVLNACRYGKPPQSPSWIEVRKKITAFAPTLWQEVFPPAPTAAARAQAAAAAAAAAAAVGGLAAQQQALPADSPSTADEMSLASATPAGRAAVASATGAASLVTVVRNPAQAAASQTSLPGTPRPLSPADEASPAAGGAVVTSQPGGSASPALLSHPGIAQVVPGMGIQLAPAAPAAAPVKVVQGSGSGSGGASPSTMSPVHNSSNSNNSQQPAVYSV